MDPNPPPRVIGIGNPFSGDDAAGLWVARRLKALAGSSLEVLEHSGEATGLMALFEGRRRVVLVDAIQAGGRAGAIHRFDALAEALPAGHFLASTHHFGVAEAVEWARALGRLPEALEVNGIEGADFSVGEHLSEPVRAAVETLARELNHRFCAAENREPDDE